MRLAATMVCDLRVQWRNGFYYASAAVAIVFVLLIRWLPSEVVEVLLPLTILQNVIVNSFYLVAGLILLENGERTRAAQSVTPLRTGEYLGSKVLTLGALTVVESLVLVVAARSAPVDIVPITIGVALASILMTLIGAALVARYHAINDFIMPSVVYTAVLGVPMLGWLGIGSSALYAWHPLHGPLSLIGAPFRPLSLGQVVWSAVIPLVWIAPAYVWSRRALRRSVRA